MLKNILFVSSLFFSFIHGKNIEHCNKIGSMQNNINNSPMYSMGLYVCLELPKNNLISKNSNISKNNKKEKGKFLSNFTKLNSENITDFKKNFTFDSPHSNITDIGIISPSPFAFTNNPSPSISPSISQSISPSISQSISPSISQSISPSISQSISPSISPSLHNNKEYAKKNDEPINGLLIAVITISSLLVVFLTILIVYMCYKHNYCKNKNKYICKNKTTPDKKNEEINHAPDIENGEILKKHKSFQNLKTKKKLKKAKLTIHKKIINVQENPNNKKSPKMIIQEKSKALNTNVKNKGKLMILTESP